MRGWCPSSWRLDPFLPMMIPAILVVASLAGQAPETSQVTTDPAEPSVRATLAEVEAFQGVSITLQHGVAELTGEVPSTEASDGAARLVSSFEGVRYVENLLSVAAPDREEIPQDGDSAERNGAAGPGNTNGMSGEDRRIQGRLRAVYGRVEELSEIQVDVVGGVVHLTGTALDSAAVEQAKELAESMDGVVLVDNDARTETSLRERLVPSFERFAEQVRGLVAALPLLFIAGLVVAAFVWLSRRLAASNRLFPRLSDSLLVQSLARQLVRAAVVIAGIFLALEILGATALVGAVLGSVGVISLALGLAFRDIAENYLASIILSIRRPFITKDIVEIEGEIGKVIRMTTRDTALMTFDGNHVLLPNATVFKSKVINYSRAANRRFKIGVGFGSDVDLRAAIQLGIEKLEKIPGVLGDPAPAAWIEALGDSNVQVNFCGWVNQRESDFNKTQSEAIRVIKETMDDHGFDMPVPTYKLDIVSGGTASTLSESAPEGSEPVARPSRAPVDHADVALDSTLDAAVEDELRESSEEDLLAPTR